VITFEVAASRKELSKLSDEAAKPGFWDDQDRARTVMARISGLEEEVGICDEAAEQLAELEEMNRLGLEEEDPAFEGEIGEGIGRVQRKVSRIETASLLQGEFDTKNAIVSLHPGAGGLESQDWAEMLLRMYSRWAEAGGFE